MEEKPVLSLHAYIRNGLTEDVKSLIAQGADINEKDKDGDTPLHVAVCRNRINIVEILVKAGANLTVKDQDTNTAYSLALAMRRMIIIRILLKAGANVLDSHTKRPGANAVHLAAESADISLMTWLLDNFHDEYVICAKSRDNWYAKTPLHYIAANWKRKGLTAAEILLSRGAKINARDYDGDTPLHEAAARGNNKYVKFLIKNRANVHVRNQEGQTPLTRAIPLYFASGIKRRIEIIQTLVHHGADVNSIDRTELRTPLIRACNPYSPKHKIIKCLLKNGADVNAVDDNGYTAMMHLTKPYADIQTSALSTKLLFDNGADINVVAPNGHHVLANIEKNKIEDKFHDSYTLILGNIAILQALNLPVNQILIDCVSKNDGYQSYFTQCQEEVLRAKNTKLHNSWVTFFNLLVDNEYKLMKYAGNMDLVADLKTFNYIQKFPIYAEQIFNNMQGALIWRTIWNEAATNLSTHLPILDPGHLIIKDVLDCLKKRDLEKLFFL